MSDTPTADPNFVSTGWGLSKAEHAQAIAALQRAGVPAEKLNPAKAAQAAPAGKPPAPVTEASSEKIRYESAFGGATDPAAYRVAFSPYAASVANDPAVGEALAGKDLVAEFRSGAVALGLPAQIGGSVIQDALEGMGKYARMSEAERVAFDMEQERIFGRAIKGDLQAAKSAVAALVSKWQAANPTLVNALLSRGLFHDAGSFVQLHLAAKRAASSKG
jgi:hypothetical protein